MDELLDQFLTEARELGIAAVDSLNSLKAAPGDTEKIAAAFRAIHTMKGSTGLFDFAPMGQALHAAEDLLGAWRSRGAADPSAIDTLLGCVGTVEDWVEAIAATGHLPPGAAASGAALARAIGGGTSAAEPAALISSDAWLPDFTASFAAPIMAAHAASLAPIAIVYTPEPDAFFRGDDPIALIRAVPDLRHLRVVPRTPWARESFDPFRCNLVIEALSTAPYDTVVRAMRLTGSQTAMAAIPPPPRQAAASRTLRIEATRVDALADLLGELIVAKNRLAHLAAQAGRSDPGLGRALHANQQDIDRLTGALHRGVAAMRLVPLSTLFRRLPRLAADTAQRLGKPIALQSSGGEVEADKAVADGLYDILLHAIRNAADHGIEPPPIRAAAGKPATGCIALAARPDGELIVITVADDGAGIDPSRVRRSAMSRQVIDQASLDALDDAAAIDLLFAPGFSTAAAVTDISGRGVGLDAVRRATAALGGTATLSSRLGHGTTLTLRVPQAVAITTIIVVRVGNDRFGVRLDNVTETLRLPRAALHTVNAGIAFVHRGHTVPLVRLANLLGLPRTAPPPEARIMLLALGDQRIGVEVDGFAERLDVVLRPLTGLLASFDGIAGTALLGDGSVLMVLGLASLISRAATENAAP